MPDEEMDHAATPAHECANCDHDNMGACKVAGCDCCCQE